MAVILSLWRFEDFAHGRGRYLTSQNLRPIGTKNRKTELDYAYLLMNLLDTSYELVLGQATRMGDFTDDDTRRMAELSERFARRPYLAFSTLRDRYSDADKARLRDLASRGYRVIAFTREELDPYALYNRFDQTRHKYAVTLAQVSENTLHLNAT